MEKGNFQVVQGREKLCCRTYSSSVSLTLFQNKILKLLKSYYLTIQIFRVHVDFRHYLIKWWVYLDLEVCPKSCQWCGPSWCLSDSLKCVYLQLLWSDSLFKSTIGSHLNTKIPFLRLLFSNANIKDKWVMKSLALKRSLLKTTETTCTRNSRQNKLSVHTSEPVTSPLV